MARKRACASPWNTPASTPSPPGSSVSPWPSGPPDVTLLSVNTDLPAFAREGALSPIEAPARRSALLQAFYPGFVRESRASTARSTSSSSAASPRSTPTSTCWATGAPSSPAAWQPATWDGLLEVCRRTAQVLRLEEPVYGVTTSWWELQPCCGLFGGPFSDSAGGCVADRAHNEAFQFVADLVHRHAIAVGTKRAQTEFVRGGRAFLSGSSAALTEIVDGAPFGVGALPLPARAPGVPGDGPDLRPARGRAGLSLLASWKAGRRLGLHALHDRPERHRVLRRCHRLPARPGGCPGLP